MLRKRSRPAMIPSPTPKFIKPTTPFPSPILFMGFTDSDAAMSPTSILETKLFSTFFDHRNPRKPHPEPITTTTPIGLGIADALRNPDGKMVLFGSQLKIQIPTITPCSISPTGLVESPNSPIEFGAKNKSSQLGALFSPAVRSTITGPCLSASEMEMSEDYTCVIAHGPNPRTTHIFDNCIVESCNGESFVPWGQREVPGDDFLAFCHGCKKSLGPGKDIFMYRGEKAFCSRECRYEEMLLDEEELMEKAS